MTNVQPLLLLFALFCNAAYSEPITGRVDNVIDGDTVTIVDKSGVQFKVRLAGIDAPESKQEYGLASKQSLADCAGGREAKVDSNKLDRYCRTVGKVMVGQVDCNLRQIKLGFPWHYKKYESEQEVEDRSVYANAEFEAQRDRRVLWQDINPVDPWDFRKLKKQKN